MQWFLKCALSAAGAFAPGFPRPFAGARHCRGGGLLLLLLPSRKKVRSSKEGYYHLIAELRKSSVPLGGAVSERRVREAERH